MLGLILLIVLILLLVGALPHWGYIGGYGPSGALTIVIVILLVLLLMGRI
jgi:hypothetical protein